MDAKSIDMDAYVRKGHFDYFRQLSYPYVGLTVNVDITDVLVKIKESSLPFFLTFLYCATNAANAVPELRQRIYNDGIIEFGSCASSYTVALEDKTYCYCSVDCGQPFEAYLPYAQKKLEEAKRNPVLGSDEDELSLFFITTVPWLSYSALVQPVPQPADSNPRISWGKFFEQGGRTLIPVSILCHHALVDGLHIAHFYKNLERQLREISS